MARINTNVSSLIARTNLARTGQELDLRLERLSTGLRINRGKDDPAGVIISERISTDLSGLSAAINNANRASSVISTTEGSLNEVSNLLNDIKGLLVQSANLGASSDEERAANQIQIDSAVKSITRIANTASFGGLNLLDGSLDFVTSGVASSAISTSKIFSASFVGAQSLSVDVDVIASAQKASLFMNGNSGIITAGVLDNSLTLDIGGSKGSAEISFTSAQTVTQMVAAVNSQSSNTGVTAVLIDPANSAMGFAFRSAAYGTDEFVSVQKIASTGAGAVEFFALEGNVDTPLLDGTWNWGNASLSTGADKLRDEGRDVTALINGNLATGDGLEVSINSPTLAMELLLGETFGTDPTASSSVFTITGGGSLFQIGPEINSQQQTSIGIQSVVASKLGATSINGTVEFLSSLSEGKANSIQTSARKNDFTAAQDILNSAIGEVSILRGRLGAFERNVLNTSQRSMQTQFANLTASRSLIQDADFASETSELTRAQILQSAGTSVLSLANQSAQSVLQLLG
ncbi:MAG: flagellin [Phycisphaerales bacterium]|jgi:flagellin